MRIVCAGGFGHGTVFDLDPGMFVIQFPDITGEVHLYFRRTYWPGIPFVPVDVMLAAPFMPELQEPQLSPRLLMIMVNNALREFWDEGS